MRKKRSEKVETDPMKVCYFCGTKTMQTVPFFEKDDPCIGHIKVQGPYTYCTKCGTGWIGGELYQRVEEAEEKMFAELLLKNYPPDKYEYLSEEEVFQKERKKVTNPKDVFYKDEDYLKHLRHFVFNTFWNGKRIYLKKSVDIHHKKGNGWFDITKPESKEESKENEKFLQKT